MGDEYEPRRQNPPAEVVDMMRGAGRRGFEPFPSADREVRRVVKVLEAHHALGLIVIPLALTYFLILRWSSLSRISLALGCR